MMIEEVPHGYVPVFQQWYILLIRATWSLQRKPVFQTEVHLKSSITLSMMKSRKEKVVLQYISPQDEQIRRHFGKASVQDERVCVLKLELVETTSLLKKEEMTPRLGGSTDVYWFMDNHSSVRKMVQDEQFLSSSESGLRFLTDRHFPVQKMVQIERSFS